MGLVNSIVSSQLRISAAFNRLLPLDLQVDGNRDFLDDFVWRYVRHGLVVWDVGGGKSPCFSPAKKAELGLRVVGLDTSAAELSLAEPGSYDRTIVADLTTMESTHDEADLVICQAVLEHVKSTGSALSSIARILRPGGTALVFVPCRKAWYARLNLMLPDSIRLRLISLLTGERAVFHGFPPYYDRCTPEEFESMAASAGLSVVELKMYYESTYFRVAFPVYLLWRGWMAARRALGRPIPETFSMALRKLG